MIRPVVCTLCVILDLISLSHFTYIVSLWYCTGLWILLCWRKSETNESAHLCSSMRCILFSQTFLFFSTTRGYHLIIITPQLGEPILRGQLLGVGQVGSVKVLSVYQFDRIIWYMSVSPCNDCKWDDTPILLKHSLMSDSALFLNTSKFVWFQMTEDPSICIIFR